MNEEKPKIHIQQQPTETSCGPTCLKAIYDYYGHKKSLESIIREIPSLEKGGTLAVQLGIHALRQGFDVTIYTYNLQVFDPTWFLPRKLSASLMIEKLKSQQKLKDKAKLQFACQNYIEFLGTGGCLRMADLSSRVLKKYLQHSTPLLTGLSSTYLYGASREKVVDTHQVVDDVGGFPEGHFIILDDYNREEKRVRIVDPYPGNPYSKNLRYSIRMERLINAILLGVMTYDANFMVIRPASCKLKSFSR
jgi:hypothetical protein